MFRNVTIAVLATLIGLSLTACGGDEAAAAPDQAEARDLHRQMTESEAWIEADKKQAEQPAGPNLSPGAQPLAGGAEAGGADKDVQDGSTE